MTIQVREPLACLPDDYKRLFGSDMFADYTELQEAVKAGRDDADSTNLALAYPNRVVWLVATDGNSDIDGFNTWIRSVRLSEVREAFGKVFAYIGGGIKDDETPLAD